MNAPAIRPRTVPEILDGAFQILREHYVPIVSATGVILLPAILLALLLPPEVAFVAALVQNILMTFAGAATVVMVADVYLGRAPDMKSALERVGANLGDILIAAILTGLVTILGFVLCIVPGIIAAAMLFATPMVVMVEGRDGSDSLGRSKDLAEGNLLRILGSTVLASIIVMVAGAGLGLVIGMTASNLGRMGDALVTLVTIFLAPFPVVVSTLMYFDLRIRKEGFGLDNLAAFRGGPEVPRYGAGPGY